jgi:Dolichyl-phosphate-mannose-protein mannosyltransferase
MTRSAKIRLTPPIAIPAFLVTQNVTAATRVSSNCRSYVMLNGDGRPVDRLPVQSRSAVTTLIFGGAVAGVVALHLATNGTLGFHTDELYYIDAGRHPAFGYVDFPPVVPLLARLETDLLGTSPWKLRVLPTLLGGVMVALSGVYVRRLGGSLRLQAIALLIAITAPYFLGANWVFQTVTFDEVTWMVALYWFLELVITGRPRYWVYLGITLGIGLEVKYTIVGLILGICMAVVLTRSLRQALRSRYPWIAAGLALLIWSPNLAWQIAEGFPSLEYVISHRGSGGGPLIYVIEIVVYLLFLLPLWIVGVVSLFRSRSLRPIGIACVLPLVLFLFVGKSYYAVGTVPIVLAQGLMAISRVKRPRLRTGFQIAVVVAAAAEFLIFAQITLPITPPDRLHAAGLDDKNELFADSVGWDDIARQVNTIYSDLPEAQQRHTVVISKYYGVPGALAIYADPNTRPLVVSPHLSDYYWLPSNVAAVDALMVDYQPADVAWMCASPTLIAHLSVPYNVKGLEQGAPVTLCRLEAPLPSLWERLRNFS